MKLTHEQKTVLIPQAIAEYIQKTGTTQANLSRITKVETTKMNYICNGKTMIPNQNGCTEIKDRYYTAICEVIGFPLSEKLGWKHFNTDNFKAIITQIEEVRAERGRGTVDGDTGAGKSYALAMYQKANQEGTFLVKCDPCENAKEFAKSLAQAVRVEAMGTTGSIIKAVADKLLTMDDAILLIDEAEHIKMKPGYINIIKSLADRLEGRVAFLLAGMEINEILQRAADRHKQNFRQTARRFSKRLKCDDDISNDISKIGEEYGFTKACINWLTNRMRNFGELEIMVSGSLKESQKLGRPVSVELLNSLYQ